MSQWRNCNDARASGERVQAAGDWGAVAAKAHDENKMAAVASLSSVC
jgi:hypothetical protein